MIRSFCSLVGNRVLIINGRQFGYHRLARYRSDTVQVNQNDGVRTITLNDPKTKNSLSMEMMEAILDELLRDKHKRELRCIVLTANGNVWSAGHDLKELSCSKKKKEIFEKLTEVIFTIQKLPVPVIAKVDALAAAAGCQLVASCDIAVCSNQSTFSTPGANFGVFCSTPGIAISRLMPRMKSSYMVLTGLPISGAEAYVAGLVSSVVPANQLDAEVEKIVSSIKSKSRGVIAFGKEFYYDQLEMDLKEAYKEGAKAMETILKSRDGKEGLDSFIEKRPPKWHHKF